MKKPKKVKVKQTINGKEVEREVTFNKPETHYTVVIYPNLWMLKFTENNRIFQDMSALDIIQKIFKEQKVTKVKDNTKNNGKDKRPYCVQYGESDFDFVSRLMEEEGIFYYFTHDKKGHTLVMADDPSAHEDIDSPEKVQLQDNYPETPQPNTLQALELTHYTTVKNLSLTDYNYQTPSTSLFSTEGDTTPVQTVYHYPGKYQKKADGDKVAKKRLEHFQWQEDMLRGGSTIFSFCPGYAMTLDKHVRKDANKKWVLYEVKHHFSVDPTEQEVVYQNVFSAFDFKKPFRPEVFRKKPLVPSAQTALVTGKAGEEIWTDDQGRIKVQFYWDQEGKQDEKTTCWIRVAQNWAGKQWGFVFTPRIGQEVVVSFLNGDPDRPLVTGSVYNKEHTPPYVGDSPNKSVIRTHSTKGAPQDRYNELSFDDTFNSEIFHAHASYDMTVDVQNDRTTDIHDGSDTLTIHAEKGSPGNQSITLTKGDRTLTLTEGNQTYQFQKGNVSTTLTNGNETHMLSSGNQDVTLSSGNQIITLGGGDRTVDITGNDTQKVSGNVEQNISGNHKITVGGNLDIEVTGTVTINGQSITMKSQTNADIEAGANMTVKAGAVLQAEGSAEATFKSGSVANIQGTAVVNLDAPASKANLMNVSGLAIGG